MSYKLKIVQKPAYLHAVVTGLNNKENVMRYLEEILRECKKQGYFQVLIEERLEGPRFKTMNVFNVASEGSISAHGYFKAIAYVDMNAEGDLMKFAETVAVNRGMPVRVFTSVADAEKWLLEEDRGGSEPYMPPDAGKPYP
jgi:hypothetical protein